MDEGASPNRTNFIKKFMNFVKKPSVHEDDVTEEEIISMVNEDTNREFFLHRKRK